MAVRQLFVFAVVECCWLFPVFLLGGGRPELYHSTSLHHKSISSGASMIFSHSSRLSSCRHWELRAGRQLFPFLSPQSNIIQTDHPTQRTGQCPLLVSTGLLWSHTCHLSPSITLLGFSQLPSSPAEISPVDATTSLLPSLAPSTPCFKQQDVGRKVSQPQNYQETRGDREAIERPIIFCCKL